MTRFPVEGGCPGLGRFVQLDKPDFIGKAATADKLDLDQAAAAGVIRRLSSTRLGRRRQRDRDERRLDTDRR